MKRTRHTAEQIIRKLKTAEQLIAQGKTVADVCRVIEVTKAIFSSSQDPMVNRQPLCMGRARCSPCAHRLGRLGAAGSVSGGGAGGLAQMVRASLAIGAKSLESSKASGCSRR